MWIWFFSLTTIVITFTISWMIYRYPLKIVPIYIRCLAAIAWFFSVSMFAFVPIDVGATLAMDKNNAVPIMWNISYWSTQIMTWLIIPIFQGYIDSGEFSASGKLKASIKNNMYFYGIMFFLCFIGILLLLITGKLSLSAIPGTCIAISNTFCLLVVVFLLGYGLVNVPKSLWLTSKPIAKLKIQTHKIGRLSVEIADAIIELERVFVIIQACHRQISRRDSLNTYMTIICDEIEKFYPKDLSIVKGQSFKDLSKLLTSDELDYALDINGLTSLRRRMWSAINKFEGTRTEYVESVKLSFSLVEICERIDKGDFYTQAIMNNESGSRLKIIYDTIYWHFKCRINPIMQQGFALILASLSVLIVWSEITILFKSYPDLSPFFKLATSTDQDLIIYLIVILPLIYIGFCTYHMLFNLSAFKFCHLIPKATSSYSLLLNASLFCRFTASLVYNYLYVIRTNSLDTMTSFSKVMGAMRVLPFFGTHLNLWLPLFLVIICLLMMFKFSENLFTNLVPSKFRLSGEGTDEDYLRKGDLLIAKERDAVHHGKNIGEILGIERSENQRMKRHLGSSSSYELDDDLENSNFSSHFRTRSLDLPLTRNNEMQVNSKGEETGMSPLDYVFSKITGKKSQR